MNTGKESIRFYYDSSAGRYDLKNSLHIICPKQLLIIDSWRIEFQNKNNGLDVKILFTREPAVTTTISSANMNAKCIVLDVGFAHNQF